MKENKYKVLIRACWVALIACFVVKLFGVNLFDVVCENEKFIKLCDFIDSKMVLKMVVACITCCISNYFTMCIIFNEKKLFKKKILIFLPLFILKSILSWYFYVISFTLDVFIIFVLPLIMKAKIKRIIITIILIFIFQMTTMFIKNVNFNLNNESFLIQIIMQIDYYVMITLYYLYIFRKEVEDMGWFGWGAFGEIKKEHIKEIKNELDKNGINVNLEIIEKHYDQMLELIKNEASN